MNTTLNAEPVQESAPEPTVTSSNFAEPAKLGLNAAARLTGASKNTILKYLNDGTLSYELNAQGNKVIQVAELQRVFPNMKVQTSSQDKSVNRREPEKNGSNDNDTAVRIATLEGEKRTLEAELKAEREKGQLLVELAEKEARNADDLRNAMKMLTYRPEPAAPAQATQPEPQPQPAPEPKRSFWARLSGAGKG